jgi:hypothetical protein
VFDDARFGLVQEPFLWDASDFITSVLAAQTREDCSQATLIFSNKMFPGANTILARTWTGEHVAEAGCEYLARYGIGPIEKSIWLCPAMTHYFGADRAPEFIYGQIAPAEGAAL